jgi:hypothetical protein
MAKDTKNNTSVPDVRSIVMKMRSGPLAHNYSRAGYTTRFEFSTGMDYSNALSLGWRPVDIRNGDGYSPETSEELLQINNGSYQIVKFASRDNNQESLILMEMPIELFREYEKAFDERNQETIDQLRSGEGRLEIKKAY